jgi:glycosyltransferase involved in cell wall biosynthesis
MSAQPSGLVGTGLERVRSAESILKAMRVTARAASEVGQRAELHGVEAELPALRAALEDAADTLTATAAVHALARLPGPAADSLLATTLSTGETALATHAAWKAGSRKFSERLVEPLIDLLVGGGLAGMHAQASLLGWHAQDGEPLLGWLEARLAREGDAAGRRAVVETIGQLPGAGATALVRRVAADRHESTATRSVALAALEDRAQHRVTGAGPGHGPLGLRVAQVHLGAEIDPGLLRSGMGDTGGVATLLVKLAAALAREPGIGTVLTIGRGSPGAGVGAATGIPGSVAFAAAPLDPQAGNSFADAWPARIAAERSLARILGAWPHPDAVHLRIADVGTLAAANVAGRLGIPLVFSLAADPHALIQRRELGGELDRRSFAAEDAQLALWYRVALVERLVRRASQLVVFPRPQLEAEMRELLGLDVAAQRDRLTVVPEGIDSGEVERAVRRRRFAVSRSRLAQPDRTGAVADLLSCLTAMPTERRGLPLVLSVGRLNEAKGMARLAAAFASDPDLYRRATLVIVGGDLDAPSAAEAAELARIAALHEAEPRLAERLVMLGHRPHAEVVELLALAGPGEGRLVAPWGIYASGSRKEEFGLALVEALAAGLPVVAPLVGGPATYIEDGVTGCLVDTTDPAALANGIHRALDLAPRPGRAEHAAALVREHYDVSAMAGRLARVYATVARRHGARLAS